MPIKLVLFAPLFFLPQIIASIYCDEIVILSQNLVFFLDFAKRLWYYRYCLRIQ